MDSIKPNSSQNIMDIVKKSTMNILNELEDHKRITVRDLTDKVIYATQMKSSVVSGVIPIILKGWVEDGEGTVELGRGGGAYKKGKAVSVDRRPRCEACHQVVRLAKNIDLDLEDIKSFDFSNNEE